MPLTPTIQPPYYLLKEKSKIYKAKLTSIGTNNPTAIEFINEIGPIQWIRQAQGLYNGNLTGAFPQNKTYILVSSDGLVAYSVVGQWVSANQIRYAPLSFSGLTDGEVVYIEVIVFP